MGTAVPTVCFFLAGCNLRRYYDDRSGYCGSWQDSDLLLVTMQILGVFGFWCQKRRERQSIWILLWIVLELLMTFQITTPDIQGMWMHVRLRYLLIGAGVQSLIPYVTMMQEKKGRVRKR